MLTVIAHLAFSVAIGSSIASRVGPARWQSVAPALPATILVALALFLAPTWGGWVFVPLVLAAGWAALVIVRGATVANSVELFLLVTKILLVAAALIVAGFCRLGLLGVIPDSWIGVAVTGLAGATAFVIGFDFADSPGLLHVEYDSNDPELKAPRSTQAVIWWKIISSGGVFVGVLLMVVAPLAEATSLTRPIVALLLAAATVAAAIWGVIRVLRLARSQPGANLRIGEFAPLVLANVLAIGLAVNALWDSAPAPIINPFAAAIPLLLVFWFFEEAIANAALNAVPVAVGAGVGLLVCSVTPAAAFLTLAAPPVATGPTTLDSVLVVAAAALVSVATFTAIGRLVFRWPSQTLQPTFVALLVDSLMYWWVVLAAGLIVSLGIGARDSWVTVVLSVAAGLVMSVILYSDVQHYQDQKTRTTDPKRWQFGAKAATRFRRVLAVHLTAQWTTALLLVMASSLIAFGVLGTTQLLSG